MPVRPALLIRIWTALSQDATGPWVSGRRLPRSSPGTEHPPAPTGAPAAIRSGGER